MKADDDMRTKSPKAAASPPSPARGAAIPLTSVCSPSSSSARWWALRFASWPPGRRWGGGGRGARGGCTSAAQPVGGDTCRSFGRGWGGTPPGESQSFVVVTDRPETHHRHIISVRIFLQDKLEVETVCSLLTSDCNCDELWMVDKVLPVITLRLVCSSDTDRYIDPWSMFLAATISL